MAFPWRTSSAHGAAAPPLHMLVLFCALGGFSNGYNTVTSSGLAERTLSSLPDQSPGVAALVRHGVFFGACFGCVIGALAADALGRRYAAYIGFSLLAAGCGVQLTAYSNLVVGLLRVVLGVGVGICSLVEPLYAAELSQASYRGTMVSVFPFAYGVGVGTSYAASSSSGSWSLLVSVGAIPAMVLMVVVTMMPESPAWLESIGALRSTGRSDDDTTEETASLIDESAEGSGALSEVPGKHTGAYGRFRTALRSYATFLYNAQSLWVLALALGVVASHAFSGVLVIITEPRVYFSAALGISKSTVDNTLVALFVVDIVGVGSGLSLVDRNPRRKLVLTGLVGTVVLYFAIGVSALMVTISPLALVVISLLLVLWFKTTVIPGVFAIVTEIWPRGYRAAGLSLTMTLTFLANFLTTSTFDYAAIDESGRGAAVGWGAFILGAIATASACFIGRYLPETRGVSLDDIDAMWAKRLQRRGATSGGSVNNNNQKTI